MCRVLGVVSKKSVNPAILQEFRRLSENGKTPRDYGCKEVSVRSGHPDGWGIALLAGDGEVYRRSVVTASKDPLFDDTLRDIDNLQEPPFLLMAHLRRAPRVETIMEKFCEPYRRELRGHVVFYGYNGYIEGYGVRDGRTDSQLLFEKLLEKVEAAPIPSAQFKKSLVDLKGTITSEFGKKVSSLTFLLSDGEEIIAHRDARGCKPYYSLHLAKTDDMYIVCSEVLPAVKGSWRLMRNNETVAFSAKGLRP